MPVLGVTSCFQDMFCCPGRLTFHILNVWYGYRELNPDLYFRRVTSCSLDDTRILKSDLKRNDYTRSSVFVLSSVLSLHYCKLLCPEPDCYPSRVNAILYPVATRTLSPVSLQLNG